MSVYIPPAVLVKERARPLRRPCGQRLRARRRGCLAASFVLNRVYALHCHSVRYELVGPATGAQGQGTVLALTPRSPPGLLSGLGGVATLLHSTRASLWGDGIATRSASQLLDRVSLMPLDIPPWITLI
jgi:hypothetical protein